MRFVASGAFVIEFVIIYNSYMNLVEISEGDYRKFEESAKTGNLLQDYLRADFRKTLGFDSYTLGVFDKKDLKACMLLLVKNGEAMIQLGPVMDYSDLKLLKFVLEEISEFCSRKNVYVLEIFPPMLVSIRDKAGNVTESFEKDKVKKCFAGLGFEFEGETIGTVAKANRFMAVKDLSEIHDDEALSKSYNYNVRRTIKKYKDQVYVETLKDLSKLSDIMQPISDSNKRNGVNDRSASYFEDMKRFFGDELVLQVAYAKDSGEAIASHVFFNHAGEIVSFLAGISEKNKQLNGMTFLYDAFYKYAIENGLKRANLYGVEGDFSEKNQLLRFKGHFGIFVEEYVGGFKIVLDKKAYAKANRKKKLMGGLRKIKRLIKK